MSVKEKLLWGTLIVLSGIALIWFYLGTHKVSAWEETPIVTANPCDQQDWYEKNPCITPTITPEATPSATPTPGAPGNPPTFQGSTTNAPAAATCNIAFSSPVLNGFQVKGNGSVTFNWLSSAENVDKFSIIYGYSPNSLIYGEDNIPSSSKSITLNGLQPGNSVFAQIWAWKSGCAEVSNIFDPIIE